jgi:hypothetical protein
MDTLKSEGKADVRVSRPWKELRSGNLKARKAERTVRTKNLQDLLVRIYKEEETGSLQACSDIERLSMRFAFKSKLSYLEVLDRMRVLSNYGLIEPEDKVQSRFNQNRRYRLSDMGYSLAEHLYETGVGGEGRLPAKEPEAVFKTNPYILGNYDPNSNPKKREREKGRHSGRPIGR